MFEDFKNELNDHVCGVERFTLISEFDHFTNMGQGICTVHLFYVDSAYRLIDLTNLLVKHGLAKMNRKQTRYIMTSDTIDYIKFYFPELKVDRV